MLWVILLQFFIEFLISLVIKSECTFLASKLHCSSKHIFYEHSTVNSIHHICRKAVCETKEKETNMVILWFFFYYMLLFLPTYESDILHNHKIIFSVFSDGSLWSSGMKPHLKHAFFPCGLFAQSIYRKNSEIHK